MNNGDIIQQTSPTILGRYRLIKQIGKGGMGEVWLAEDPRLHRQVAIKTLPIHTQKDDEFLLRFEREARSAAALNHPHILPVHDYGKQPLPDDQLITYIVMPYITGGTLADRIAEYNNKHILMPQHEAITYLSQAAEAIDYAHKHSIIHRDIKPGNMMLRSDNWLLLGDFGIARLLSSKDNLTQTGTGTGTPEYMAPEQAQGRAEAASDIYSLAVLAYYLFTSRLPFQALTAYATVIEHITSAPPPPRQINPALSSQQERAILHGLAKQPSERPASASALVAELQQASSNVALESQTRVFPEQGQTGNSQWPVTGPSHPSAFAQNSQWPITGPSAPNNWQPMTNQSHPPVFAPNNQSPITSPSHLPSVPVPDNRQPITNQSHVPALTQNRAASEGAEATPNTSMQGTFINAATPAQKKQISRRTLLIGGGAALVILAGGAGTWAVMNHTQKPATTSPSTAISTDPNGPDLILRGHTKPVTSLAWSSQSETFLASAAEDGTILLWPIQAPQQQQVGLPSASTKQVFRTSGPLLLSWSADGKLLAIGNTGKGKTASIEVYTADLQKMAPGYTVIAVPNVSSIAGLAWQNNYLTALAALPAQAGQKQLQLSLRDTQQPQKQLEPILIKGNLPSDENRSPLLLASPNGNTLGLAEAEGVVAGRVKVAGTTIQWQQLLGPVKPDGQIKAITWMPSGAIIGALATKNDKDFSLALWDTQRKEQDPLPTDAVLTTIAWCPATTRSLIATGSKDGRVLIWKYNGNNIPLTLDSNLKAEVITLAWSLDGQWLAAGFNDKDASILVWNIQQRGF